MGKITKPSPILRLNLPGGVETIVSKLFTKYQVKHQDPYIWMVGLGPI